MWQRRNMHRTGQNGRRQMADIRAEIKNFKEAVYGEDVRGSMISLAEKVNGEIEKTTKLAQDTDKKAEGFNQRIEDNKNAVAKLRNDHNTDIIALTQSKADAIINTATGEHIAVGDSSGHLLDNLKIYGKSVQNGTPTPDSPVPIVSTGDKGRVNISIHGKQLFDASKLPTKSAGGATVTNNGDGSFTCTATNNLSSDLHTFKEFSTEDSKAMIKSGYICVQPEATGLPYVTGYPYFYVKVTNSTGLLCEVRSNKGKTDKFELTQEMVDDVEFKITIGIYGQRGNNTIAKTIRPMLYQDGDGTWEPFKPLQSLSIPTANGLLGIPTESGGNYTDQKGQQWICDSIDLGRGKYVHRVKKLVLNGTENFIFDKINDYGIANFFIKLPIKSKARKSFCSHLLNKDTSIAEAKDEGFTIVINEGIFLRFNSTRIDTVEALKAWLKENPVTIIYMNEPLTESDIPAEVFEAYKKLYSNYPSTVIKNYSGTDMELSYVADTKNYTDNKIKEAVSAQTQSLANLLSLMPLSTQAAMIEADTNNILDNMEVTEHE